MRQLILIFTMMTLCSASAYAQKIKVRKVKGNSAIVESNSPLNQGGVYDLISQDQFGGEDEPANRNYSLGFNFNFSNTKSDAANATSRTDATFIGRFGWNLATWEFGPLVRFVMTHANDATTTTWGLGGFGDYNFTPNITNEAFIFGLTGWGSFGNEDRGTGTKVDLVDVFGGLFVKWFPTASSACFRVDFGYLYERQTVTGGYYTSTGLSASAGIYAYF